jgi:hypothetical protein|tara:strand:+ start:1489 stop:1650 length:162 start_codon:yes stop_codon:yes gene_type:complete
MKLKVFLTLDINKEEYHVPSDGDVASEIDDALREYIHDVGGLEVSSLKINMER